MKVFWLSYRWIAVCCLLFVLGGRSGFALNSSSGSPTANDIIQRMIARAHSTNQANARSHYAYAKLAVTEDLDGKGRVKERKEKLLEFESGVGSLVQMKINGQPIPAAELKRRETEAASQRQQVTQTRSGQRDDNWGKFLNSDLIAKYTFNLLSQELVNGRPTYVVAFQPARSDLPVNQMADRLLNQLCGKLWIDSQEFEIARAELGVQSEVTLWGGVLASLKTFHYAVERLRLTDGTWFNRLTRGEFAGRKLFEPMHIRTRTESSNFRPLVAAGLR